MSGVFVEPYSNQARKSEIQAALGGRLWWEHGWVIWLPWGSAQAVRIPYRDLSEPFSADEFVAAARAAWQRSGARL